MAFPNGKCIEHQPYAPTNKEYHTFSHADPPEPPDAGIPNHL